jgi:dihydroorotate dehydrogenase
MAKYILTKKRSSSWDTIKEGETIVIEVSSSLHYTDVLKYLEKIGKKPNAFELNLSSLDVQKM